MNAHTAFPDLDDETVPLFDDLPVDLVEPPVIESEPATLEDDAARHGLGGNNPPEPTPYEAAKAKVDDLANEAQHWLDGSGVNSQPEADAVGKLVDMLRKAHTEADNARKVENEPFDKGKAEVQARYNPVLTRAKTAVDTAKLALAPWLAKVKAEQDAIAKRARDEADRLAKEAAEAMRASDATNLAEREAAEALVLEASKASRAANRAETTTAKAGGGAGHRAIGLRSYYTARLVDDGVALAHFLETRLADIDEYLTKLAQQTVDAAGGDAAKASLKIPGFVIDVEQRAV